MYISDKEHARLRYMERAIERLVELLYDTPPGQAFLPAIDRVLEPFRIAREKRHAAHKETLCHAHKHSEG